MTRVMKLVAVLALLIVLGAGAGLVALKLFLPEAKVRAWVVDAARRQLGREVRLSGIAVGLTGLRLQELEISERPDFEAGTFLRVESFALRPSWKALLRKRLVVASAAADGLSVQVRKRADGTFNYETLASSAPAAATAAKSSEGPAPELNVRHLRIRGGAVDYRDEQAGATWAVSDLALTLDDFNAADPFRLDVSLRVRGKAAQRPVDAAVALAGTIHPARGDRAKFKAEIKSLSIEQDEVKLSASGVASGLDSPAVDLDASGSVAGKTLLRVVGGLRLASAAQDGARVVDVDMALKTPGLDTIRIANLAPKAGIPVLVLPAAEARVAGRWDGQSLTLKRMDLSWNAGKISASGAVRHAGSAKPVPDLALRFSASFPSFRLSELPVAVSALPPSFLVPALRLDGGARVRGDDVTLEKVSIKGKSGELRLNGLVAKALAGASEPALDVQADLDLPALTDKDIPVGGMPAGLELPPSRWDVDLSYARRALRVRKLALKIASNEFNVEGGVSDPAGRAAFDLLVKCRRFVLEELTRLTPQTRDLRLSGSGLFALSVTGNKEKPTFGGKLQFKGFGATVAELPLSGFTGTVSFDEKRIDVPNLKGKVADGSLAMDLTVKNYAQAPEIQLEASLDRFDLGKFQATQKKLAAQKAAKAPDRAAAAAAKPAVPLRSSGRIDIGALTHPNATVEKVAVSWDLYGITPDMAKLTGDAKLNVGGGTLHAIGDMAAQSPVIKVLLFPILIIQTVGRLGGISIFPNFNDITVHQIVGDYAFKNGLMTLRRSGMDANVARVSAKGTIDLPSEALDLLVTAQVANVAPIDVGVTGTVSSPKTSVKVLKFLATPATQVLKGLEGLLKR
ncbi:MAG: AsmA family protein [Elusimicrobia bacterium]|nr:AsmA family protein [Elusimicrobiota bacterium]